MRACYLKLEFLNGKSYFSSIAKDDAQVILLLGTISLFQYIQLKKNEDCAIIITNLKCKASNMNKSELKNQNKKFILKLYTVLYACRGELFTQSYHDSSLVMQVLSATQSNRLLGSAIQLYCAFF